MMMDSRCPYCDSIDISYKEMDRDWVSEEDCIVTNEGRCWECDKHFIVSEVVSVPSRIVAKDRDELDRLVKEELDEGY